MFSYIWKGSEPESKSIKGEDAVQLNNFIVEIGETWATNTLLVEGALYTRACEGLCIAVKNSTSMRKRSDIKLIWEEPAE